MERGRRTPGQIVRKLGEDDRLLLDGVEVTEIGKALETPEHTDHRWQARFGAMQFDKMMQFNEPDRENAR